MSVNSLWRERHWCGDSEEEEATRGWAIFLYVHICDRTCQNDSIVGEFHNELRAITTLHWHTFWNLSFYQETIAKTLFFQMVAVYMSITQLKWTYFGDFATPINLHFNAWHHWGTKMVQFCMNNSPSKYSLASPYLVSMERVIYILATDILFGKYFPWRFPTIQFWPGGNQNTIHVCDWSNVPNSSLGWPCNGLFTFSLVSFLFELVISLLIIIQMYIYTTKID